MGDTTATVNQRMADGPRRRFDRITGGSMALGIGLGPLGVCLLLWRWVFWLWFFNVEGAS